MKYILIPAPINARDFDQTGAIVRRDVPFAEYVEPLLNDQRWRAPLKHQRLAQRVSEALWMDPLADKPEPRQKPGDIWAIEDAVHELLVASMNAPQGIMFFPTRRQLLAFGDAIENAPEKPPALAAVPAAAAAGI